MDTPVVAHLMRAYFHQDWDIDGTPDEVVDLFLRLEPYEPQALANDIYLVLSQYDDDKELENALDQMGCQYLPGPGEGGYRGWLQRIAQYARTQ